MPPIIRDPDLDQRFASEGFATTRLLAAEGVATLLDAVRALSPADGFRPDGTGDNQRRYHCTFLDESRGYRRAFDELVRRTFYSPLRDLLPGYEILTSNLYVKPPGTGEFEIHQNWPTVPSMSTTTVTVWCPLQDVDTANGTIHVVPRSHRIVPDIAAITADKYFLDFYDELIDHWLVPVPLAAGECVVFDDTLLHWSDRNRSEDDRWAVQIELIPSGADPVVYFLDTDHDPPRFELYRAGPDFYLDHGVSQLVQRPTELELVGTTPAPNRRLTEAEFAALIDGRSAEAPPGSPEGQPVA